MTRRAPKPSYPSAGELAMTLIHLRRDALAILPMYQRLHSLGLEPPRGSGSVHTSGSAHLRPDGSETGYVPELAVESAQAQGRREYAIRIAADVARAAEILFKAQQSLEHNVGPAMGYRQPESLGNEAYVSLDQFTESVANQAARLKAGNE